ncbi:unnamed protein product [Lupinus luteus]|uniref:Amine oxidase domain-containing protein n=1 Tax=Lupinus luteus TaxID=3873 RepID=A0AAV1W3A8_LUPLU
MELRQIMGGGFSKDTSFGLVLEKLKLLYGAVGSVDEKQLLERHFANLEYVNVGCLSNLSAAHWDQDDPYEMGGDHCFLVGGNWRLINALSEVIPIFYERLSKLSNMEAMVYFSLNVSLSDPIQSACTKWDVDPFSFGSYSNVSVGSSGGDYDILAENVRNRLFFAGEATIRQYPTTMHGAFLRGLREASHIYKLTHVPHDHHRKTRLRTLDQSMIC